MEKIFNFRAPFYKRNIRIEISRKIKTLYPFCIMIKDSSKQKEAATNNLSTK